METKEIISVLKKSKDEIIKNDFSDFIPAYKKYFWTGNFGVFNELQYNYAYGAAIALIGKVYGDNGKSSDYHKGIKIVSERVDISKTEIKTLRKNYKKDGGYCYKIPFVIAEILNTMIELLVDIDENEHEVIELYKKQYKGVTYREVLMGRQYQAIKYIIAEAKSEGKDDEKLKKIKKIGKNMEDMIQKI